MTDKTEAGISRWTTTCEECGATIHGESECFLCPVDYDAAGNMVVGSVWAPIVGICECGHAALEGDADWIEVLGT